MRAPNSMSFLSKAYNFLKGKTSVNDENFYAKTKSSFPKDIYPIRSEPIIHKELPSISRKNRRVLGEISNRHWSVTDDSERKPQPTANSEGFSPHALVRNYWTGKGGKKVNNDVQPASNNKMLDEQGEDDEEEGIFTIQLIKPLNGFLGIVLVGGADTPLGKHYVNDILPNSSASKSGRVRNGDELLEANGKALTGKTHTEALAVFRSLPAVVELVVARTKDANRAILERLHHEKKGNRKVNNNIASPERRRSIIEEAAKTSVMPSSHAFIIDVPKKARRHVKPVRRVSRVSSFVGTGENKIATNNEINGNGKKQEVASENRGSNIMDIKEARNPASSIQTEEYVVYSNETSSTRSKTPDSLPTKSFPLSETFFDLPQIHEDEALRYSTIRRSRSRTLNGYLKKQSIIELSDSRATWPAFTTKQRLPLPWDSCAPPRPATVGRSSSARIRRNIATISASNPPLYQGSSVRKLKLKGKHYIESKTLTIEIQRESTNTEWGFTIGGGICSPYGDLPISIADVSPTGVARGLLQKGDEIVDFSEESFAGSTFLEAEKMLRRCTKKKVSVTIKRKFLQRCQNPERNPYADAWRSLNTTNSSSGCKQRKRPKSIHR